MLANQYYIQIGGHTTILTYDENTICKLAKFQEQHFYENLDKLPKDLLEYIPKYKGSIQVIELTEENDVKTYYTRCTESRSNGSSRRNSDEVGDVKNNCYLNIISKAKRQISTSPPEGQLK